MMRVVAAAVFVGTLVAGAAASGCGAARASAASEIARARVAYFRAEAGPATVVAEDELRDAKWSLDVAERAFRDHPDDPHTADLAYIAARRAEIVESHAGLLLARRRKLEAVRELHAASALPEEDER